MNPTDPKAMDLFTRVFARTVSGDSMVYQFMRLTESTVGSSQRSLVEENVAFLQRQIPRMIADNAWLGDPKTALDPALHKAWASQMAEMSIGKALSAVDAAAVVFSHSLLDSALDDLLELSCHLDPEWWDQHSKDRAFRLSELAASSLEVLRERTRWAHLKSLQRQSLPRKTDRLYEACSPPPGYSGVSGYEFSRARVTELDTLRHRVVHGLQVTGRINQTSEIRKYCADTALHFVSMVNHRYDVRMNPVILKDHMI